MFFAKQEDTKVSVALNPSAPAELLQSLASTIDPSNYNELDLYVCLAQNPNTPSEVLSKLSKHKFELVRTGVAQNPNLPISVLLELVDDTDVNVCTRLAQNKHTPPEVLAYMYKKAVEKDYLCEYFVRAAVAGGIRLPETELCALVACYGLFVAREIALNIKVGKNSVLDKQMKKVGYPAQVYREVEARSASTLVR